MIIRKLRLQKGWSQEQLAELTGLSTRTIQRIEKGSVASQESISALASVFAIDREELLKTLAGDRGVSASEEAPVAVSDQHSTLPEDTTMTDLNISAEEKKAFEYIEKLKGFYYHIIAFIFVIACLTGLNFYVSPGDWWIFWIIGGWLVGVVLHAIWVFDGLFGFGPEWEKRKIEQKLGRKL